MQGRTVDSDDQAHRRVLEGLFWLRNVAVAAQLAVLLLVVVGLKIQLQALPILLVIAALWLWNLVLGQRLDRRWPVTAAEIAVNLVVDMLALGALLYWSGGSTNPFVSLFLVPVALAAAFLPVRYIVLVLLLAAGLYTVLLWRYVPLAPVGSRFGGDFNLHVWGMWASFILSAVIAAVFVRRLARVGQRREREVAELRARLMRDEHIVSAGALAAGVAHEMNTPLATIGLLAREVAEAPDDTAQVVADADEILRQVAHCKSRLKRLQQRAGGGGGQAAGPLLTVALEDWAALRADVAVDFDLALDAMPPFAAVDDLAMALVNLLDNAADASVEGGRPEVAVEARYAGGELRVAIDDHGRGLSPEQLRRAGRESFSSKAEGLGLGLVLSHATLERIGGRLTMTNRAGGGTRVTVRVPVPETSDDGE